MKCCVDSYSGFWDNGDTSHTPLYNMLLEKGVTDVVVCGIATDFCVGFTALDAARHGFRTVVVNEAIRGELLGFFYRLLCSSYLICACLNFCKSVALLLNFEKLFILAIVLGQSLIT